MENSLGLIQMLRMVNTHLSIERIAPTGMLE